MPPPRLPLRLLCGAALLGALALQPPPRFSPGGVYGGAPSATARRYASNASCALEPRVRCHVGVWAERPAKTPSPNVQDGPLLGNGDLGAALAAPAGVSGGNALLYYLAKSDLWATNLCVDNPAPPMSLLPTYEFYQMLGAGFLAIGPGVVPDAPAPPAFAAAQDLASATVTASVGNVSTSAIVAADANVLLVNFSFAGPAPALYNVSIIVTSEYDLPMTAGVDPGAGGAPPVIFASRSGVKTVDNSLTLMPCDSTSAVIWPAVNTWSVDGATGRLSLRNASAGAPPQCPRQVGAAKISVGACADAAVDGGASDWRLVAAAAGSGAPPGALQLQRFGSSPPLCAWAVPPAFHGSGGPVAVGECAQQAGAWWAWAEGEARLHYNASQCLMASPPNVNVTLGLAFTILGPDGAAVPLVDARASPPAGGATTLSSTAVALLQPGAAYTFVLTALSSRDTAADPVAAAVAAARSYAGAPAAVAALYAAHAAFWARYWAASSVYLGESRQLVEGAWYGLQHLIGSTARPGKVGPALWGVWNALDSAEWNGDYSDYSFLFFLSLARCLIHTTKLTNIPPSAHPIAVDYNAQANYYGVVSSNHADLLEPYFALFSSDWVLEASRQRAAANWLAKGSVGAPGSVAMSMGCGPMTEAYDNPALCPPETPGFFAGIELVTHLGPYPGLCFYTDLSLRMNGLISALPYIVYYESTLDAAFLADKAFPFLKANADFFVSYVTPNASTGGARVDILNSCANEICGQGIPVENNPHHDLAMLRAVLQALLRWAPALPRPALAAEAAALVPTWAALLAALAPYPVGADPVSGNAVFLEADGTAAIFGSQATSYPITYTASMHPAEVTSLSSPADEQAVAWNTIEALVKQNQWHPGNGLCMAWPPATRVAGAARAAGVLDGWGAALLATMHSNFWPDLGGGGIEQAGATEAINSALLQSQEGFLRFFPMWPPGENASFATLRARGGFLVSASFVGGAGVAAPVSVLASSSGGSARNCSLLSPWWPAAGAVVTRAPDNATVPSAPAPGAPDGVTSFEVAEGVTYWVWEGGPALRSP